MKRMYRKPLSVELLLQTEGALLGASAGDTTTGSVKWGNRIGSDEDIKETFSQKKNPIWDE